jgi:hypothetical protein
MLNGTYARFAMGMSPIKGTAISVSCHLPPFWSFIGFYGTWISNHVLLEKL